MGNRAHVIFTDGRGEFSPAIYLHWNGGPESVYAFLEELDTRGCRHDLEYAPARFCQLVGQFFDADGQGCLSLGVTNGPASDSPADMTPFNHGDNGIYLVSWNGAVTIVRRFTTDYAGTSYDDPPREWPAERVFAEEVKAAEHPHRELFRSFFESLRARVGVES